MKKNSSKDLKQAKAISKYLRISPRKVRPALAEIRRKPAIAALQILSVIPTKGARLAEKVLKSAIANANDLGLSETKLVITDFRADGGPVLKRFRPRSMGRADRILKRTSHLSVVLTETEDDVIDAGNPAEAEATKSSDKKTAAAS